MSTPRPRPLYPFWFADGPIQDIRYADAKKLLKILTYAASHVGSCVACRVAWDAPKLPAPGGRAPDGRCVPCLARWLKAELADRGKMRGWRSRSEPGRSARRLRLEAGSRAAARLA